MDGRRSTLVRLDHFSCADCLDLDLDRLSNGIYHLGEFPDLVQTVLTLFARFHIEMKGDIVVTVGYFKLDDATSAVFFAALKCVASVFNYSNDVRAHIGFEVQERSFPNVVFLAHFLFLVNKLLKNVINSDMFSAN